MSTISVPLRQWRYWYPSSATVLASPWQVKTGKNHLPALPFVAPMARRRLTRLSQMALAVSQPLINDTQTVTVFASTHGEVSQTTELLSTLAQRQPLSPTRFSQSVHNTAAGAFGIQFQHTAAATAIAAGEQTLFAALVEAYGQLLQQQSLLLVFVDDPLPEPLQHFQPPLKPLALALELGAPADFQLTISKQAVASSDCVSSLAWQLLDTLKHGGGTGQYIGQHAHFQWTLQ
ncbi:beta-ketoacyl synthase chain length factor [Ferrimonas senticii]|uniref:beta-ketoacyl synthase chain length factor n=1 Tax=Ferrimonas senticii TaxID=394566 RepID=UPI0004089580|nr:beta-ketoacyl synthase chain length factor [Ferrimonas senticii]